MLQGPLSAEQREAAAKEWLETKDASLAQDGVQGLADALRQWYYIFRRLPGRKAKGRGHCGRRYPDETVSSVKRVPALSAAHVVAAGWKFSFASFDFHPPPFPDRA